MNPILSNTSNIALVDTINSFFSWYYTSLRVYNRSRHNPTSEIVNITDSKNVAAFLAVFETTFHRCTKRIMNLTCTTRDTLIFAIDCPRNNVWRTDHLRDQSNKSTYKATRNTKPDPCIPLTMKYMYDKLMKKSRCLRIGSPRAEADDVIAVLTQMINARSPQREVFVISDDSDFVQLLQNPKNHLYTQRLRDYRTKIKYSPKKMLAIKILQGDRIDNIDSAFPRVGEKTAVALIDNPDLMEKKIAIYGKKKLERNRLLIDFNFIPHDIKSRIIQSALLLSVDKIK